MTRKPIIAGNWKMFLTIKEAKDLVLTLKDNLKDINSADIIVCPAFTALSAVSEILARSNISVGAQNTYWEEEGAYTGEVSLRMLKDTGCNYVIIGHSERRQFFGETNISVNKKALAVLKNNLIPIVCVGENLNERQSGKTFEIIKDHLSGAFKDWTSAMIEKTIIAYEPVWAIGTGKVATPEEAQEAHKYIRGWLTGAFGSEAAQKVRIQYGGSVKVDNAAGLIVKEDIDGALVGGASLKADSFTQIVKNSKK